MLARLRKLQEEREEGFTLIELLVVIIIIGILAAIAIPVFLQQRNKGYDAAVKSDLRNAATAEESYLTDYNTYTNQVSDLQSEGFVYSNGSNYSGGTASLTVSSTGDQSYCIQGTSASGNTWAYNSATGGLGGKNSTCS